MGTLLNGLLLVTFLILVTYITILKLHIRRIMKKTGWSSTKSFVVWQLEHVYINDYGVTKPELYERYAQESAKILFDNLETYE